MRSRHCLGFVCWLALPSGCVGVADLVETQGQMNVRFTSSEYLHSVGVYDVDGTYREFPCSPHPAACSYVGLPIGETDVAGTDTTDLP